MTDLTKRKFKACLWPTIYLLLMVAVCVSGSISFHNNYYKRFYVSQDSMCPTLEGKYNQCDYGLSDHNKTAINLLKRYQIGLMYFPSDYDSQGNLKEGAELKIKRLLVLPGERFKFQDYKLYLFDYNKNEWSDPLPMPFDRNTNNGNHSFYEDTTLDENEYFFAGDNCDVSNDCFDVGPLKYDYLSAVVVEVTGKRILNEDGSYTYKKMNKRYFPGVDY